MKSLGRRCQQEQLLKNKILTINKWLVLSKGTTWRSLPQTQKHGFLTQMVPVPPAKHDAFHLQRTMGETEWPVCEGLETTILGRNVYIPHGTNGGHLPPHSFLLKKPPPSSARQTTDKRLRAARWVKEKCFTHKNEPKGSTELCETSKPGTSRWYWGLLGSWMQTWSDVLAPQTEWKGLTHVRVLQGTLWELI